MKDILDDVKEMVSNNTYDPEVEEKALKHAEKKLKLRDLELDLEREKLTNIGSFVTRSVLPFLLLFGGLFFNPIAKLITGNTEAIYLSNEGQQTILILGAALLDINIALPKKK